MVMQMTRLAGTFLVAAILSACGGESGGDGAADLLLLNGRVYTLNWGDPAGDGSLMPDAPHDGNGWRPDASAVAVRDGQIVFVGNTRDADEYRGAATRVVDLAGATVIPGLVDSHTHVFNLGAALDQVDLVGVDTEEEAVARVAERAKSVPKGSWIVGRGWDEGAWANRYPDKVLLSERVPDHPVFLASLHTFAGWANQMALDVAGITAETDAPVGGEIRRGADGEPNGLFLNRAVPLISDAVRPPPREAVASQVVAALDQMAQDGYVTVHEAGLDAREMEILQELEASNRLPVRVYAMLSLRDEGLVREWIAKGPDRDADSMLVTRSVKAYYDGALGSRGARLLYDYSDRPGHRGVSGDDYGFNEALMEEAMQQGFQVAIHAIGDAGNREALDILERIFARHPEVATNRHRIEHAQVVHPDDIPRFGKLGIIASMEPPHAMEDKTWAEERLGPERILGAYAWRSLREAGSPLTFNSDNPGSDHDIFYGLHSAITRQDKQREPEGGWFAEQAVNVDEAIRAYTNWSAYAAFREDETGILAPGRWADITVIDIDPFVLAEQEPGLILDGRVLMTVVGGQVVYQRE
jgi:hypothetical protein